MVIYKTTFPNGKIYIGQDRYNNPKYLGSGILCLKSIKKYGKDNCFKEILRFCKNQKQLDFFEEFYIKKFNSTNPEIGYNILTGTANNFGAGSPSLIPYVKNKISESLKGKYIGSKNPNFGNKWSDEQKKKMSERVREKFESDKLIKKNISNSLKKFYSDNPEKKPIGEKNGMYGKKHSKTKKKIISIKTKRFFDNNPEVKKKLSDNSLQMWKDFKKNGRAEIVIKKRAESKKREIYQLDLRTNEKIKLWKSATDIENELGFCRMNIGKCCRDNRKKLEYQRYGYKWIYNE